MSDYIISGDPDELRQKARQLEGCLQEIDAQLKRIDQAADSTKGTWLGEASKSFFTAYQLDSSTKFLLMKQKTAELIASIRESADRLEQADMTAL